MQWATTIAVGGKTLDAFEAAAGSLHELLAPATADLVLAFTSLHHGSAAPELAAAISKRFPGAVVVGCTGAGVIGGSREVEGETALSLCAAVLPGVDAHAFVVAPGELPAVGDGQAWADLVGVDRDSEPSFILLPDPFSCDVPGLVAGLDATWPATAKVGGLASGGQQPGSHTLLCGKDVYRAGAVGVALSGNIRIDTVVAQGCRPIGQPVFVTRCEPHVIHELDGRPAAEVLGEVFAALSEADQALARQSLFLGLVMDEGLEEYGPGDFLIRNIVGVDPSTGAMAVAATLGTHKVAQFHLRDAATSATDLEGLLSAYALGIARPPAGALLFSCTGRGQHLYGTANHDTDVLHAQLGDVPVAGFFCNGEIGPVQGHTHLHGYTSAFALFRARHDG